LDVVLAVVAHLAEVAAVLSTSRARAPLLVERVIDRMSRLWKFSEDEAIQTTKCLTGTSFIADGKMQPQDWLESRETQCART
jgi:hypothetical protein